MDVTEVTPKKDWRERFIGALEKSPNVARACRLAGVSRVHAYRTKADDAEFRERWEAAHEAALDALEEVAHRRAKQASDTLLIFLLKSHRPDIYRETVRNEHTGKNGGPIETTHRPDLKQLSPEELIQLEQLVGKTTDPAGDPGGAGAA